MFKVVERREKERKRRGIEEAAVKIMFQLDWL